MTEEHTRDLTSVASEGAGESRLFPSEDGSPYASVSNEAAAAMLDAIGVDDVEALFDIPDAVRFEGSFDIPARSEAAVNRRLSDVLETNDVLTEFLGRGHYTHAVPSVVDHLSLRSEFLTSYTQYQPEVTQGFLQALFEYQSLLVELTGLSVANCSMYDAATALGEAATLASRVRSVSGTRVLVPSYVRPEYRNVLENYVSGTDLCVETVPAVDGMVDPATLEEAIDDDVAMVYAENPTVEGVIEEHLSEIGTLADAHDAVFCLGSDTVALSLLERPADVGADVVVGDASVLGLPAAHGMGLGLFACREEFLRQVPGRLVGASEDAAGARTYTLTLQTREQHIRRERATSNICTNQAWVALRAAIHATWLGPDRLVETAEMCHRQAEALAADLDDIDGVTAPVRDCHHFREFMARVDADSKRVAEALRERGFVVHVLDEETIQVCVTDANAHDADALVAATREVLA
jgi:glycine dehydrogenase subunit 1